MKGMIKKLINILLTPFILGDYFKFKGKISGKSRFPLLLTDAYPQVKDKTITTGFDRHYVYHTAWAVRKVREIAPLKHIDISSSLYFSSLLSAFVPVEFYDYRPPVLVLDNLKVGRGDLLHLPFADNSIVSLSCMHTIEHVGLGRYGDEIDPDGDLKAVSELKRAVAPGGSILFVVPIGKPKIMFNAHRIYSYEQVVDMFSGFRLKEFSLIPENACDGDLIINAAKEQADKENYGCGCFWFIK